MGNHRIDKMAAQTLQGAFKPTNQKSLSVGKCMVACPIEPAAGSWADLGKGTMASNMSTHGTHTL